MDTRIVYHARNSAEATVLQGWLKEAGIEAYVFNDEQQAGGFDLGMETAPQVTVDEKDYEKAREIAHAYEAELNKETDMSAVTDAEGQFDWPICPQCDELQHATCSNCETTGSEFAANEDQSGPKSICLACSQPTEVQFIDICKFCGHNFSMPSAHEPVASEPVDQPDTRRVMMVMGVLAVLIISVVFYLLISSAS